MSLGTPDVASVRAAVRTVLPWLEDASVSVSRADQAAAVRLSLRLLAHRAPGGAVEVRVPPFGVVQCVEGPRHSRGTPPNVVECSPRVWLCLVAGLDCVTQCDVSVSGVRAAEVLDFLPLVAL